MPIYEYQCKVCQETFETLTTSATTPTETIVCPSCKSEDVVKLLSAGNLRSSAKASFSAPPVSGPGCGSGGFS